MRQRFLADAAGVPATDTDTGTGDRRTQDRFCRRYLPQVRRWLQRRWRHGTLRSWIGDGVQEVFLECCRPGGVLDRTAPTPDHAFGTCLRAVVRNVAARIERREARAAACGKPDGSRLRYVEAPAAGGADLIDWPRIRAEVAAAIGGLDAEPCVAGHSLGELLQLWFAAGVPVPEIASRWHERPDTIQKHRRRACRLLRRSLARAIGIDVHAMPPASVVELLAT